MSCPVKSVSSQTNRNASEILRHSSPVTVRNSFFTLEQFIERVRGPSRMIESASRVTRNRSSSFSDFTAIRSPPPHYRPIRMTENGKNLRGEERGEEKGGREDPVGLSKPNHLTTGLGSCSWSTVGSQTSQEFSPLKSWAVVDLTAGLDSDEEECEPSLEVRASLHRQSASQQQTSLTWCGQLPHTSHLHLPLYSRKVFLGGVPWDVTEKDLGHAFNQFGAFKIEWPGKGSSSSARKGFLYIIFNSAPAVNLLLSRCSLSHNLCRGAHRYQISSRRLKNKEIQVIPWQLGDSNFARSASYRLDPQRTVFVGALHGTLKAEGLACIFNDLFGGVVYAGIDTDRFKYPIGSGRVTFNNAVSYMKAVSAAFIEIKTQKFSKKVQVDPYLEDALCSICLVKQGPYFCRDLTCFKYYCRYCWELQHSVDVARSHMPLARQTRKKVGFYQYGYE